MRRLVSLLIGPCALLGARSAAAQTATANTDAQAEVRYSAPAECPDEDTFRADVAKHVHDESHAAGVRVELSIEARAGEYGGQLTAFDGEGNQGSRQITGKTCAEVAHALAFLTGLVIELGGHIESDPEQAAAAPAKPVPPPPVPVKPPLTLPAPPLASTRAPGPRWSAVALVDVRGAFGPSVRPTAELGVELGSAKLQLWSPAARALVFAGNSELQGADGSAALRFIGGRFEFCPLRWGSQRFALRSCAGGELGAVQARGRIATEPKTVTKPWAAAEVSVRLQWFASKALFAELGAGPVLPLVRTHYFFEPDQTLYSVPAVSARAALGLGLLF